MKIVRNNIIPFKGFAAINLFGVLFVRKRTWVSQWMINHEKIHTAQMKEMLYVGFYLWYVIEWIIRLFLPGNAYKNISFEREAYRNELDIHYLDKRRHFNWFYYITHDPWKVEE